MSQGIYVANTKYDKMGDVEYDFDFFDGLFMPMESRIYLMDSAEDIVKLLRDSDKATIMKHKETLRKIFKAFRSRKDYGIDLQIF